MGLQLGRNDAFQVVGGIPGARIIEGKINRVDATTKQVFVISPTFDAGAEFGPVQYDGPTPTVGKECVVAVMTGTTESWLLSWDGAFAGLALDPWHIVGAGGEPAFQNGWRSYGNFSYPQPSNYGGPRFRRDPAGLITLTGLMDKAGGNFIALETFFTLPVGYRPDTQIMFSTKMLGGATENDGRIDVFPSGVVRLNSGGLANPVSFVSLEGIQFYASDAPAMVLTGPKGDPGPAAGLLGYAEITAPVAISATTFPGANVIISSPSIVCDGLPVEVEFFAPYMAPAAAAGAYIQIMLWQDATDLGVHMLLEQTGPTGFAYTQQGFKRRLTPAAGPHIFSVRGLCGIAANGTAGAGNGTASNYAPAFIAVRKA